MKGPHSIMLTASLIGCNKSPISRELRLNADSRGYRSKQASELATERVEQSRNAYTVCGRVRTPKQAKSPSQSLKRLLEVPISNVSSE